MAFMNWLEQKFTLKKTSDITDTITDDEIDELKCKEIAFYIATSYIANTISKCEFKVYENKKEVKNELYYSLNVKPNPNDTASRLKNKIIQKLYYEGEALVFEHRGKLYCADSFNKEEHPLTGNIFKEISLDNETTTKTKKASDVYYFNLENNKEFGKVKALVDSMYNDYKNILSYAIKSFESSNSEKYILNIDRTESGDSDFKDKYNNYISAQLKKFMNNPKSIWLQHRGYKLENVIKPSGTTSSSDDIRNIKKDVMETVAEAFKMPVSMLYGNMTNVKELISYYLTFTIDPIAKMISEELTANSFSYDEWKKGCYVRVDTTKINHLDVFEIGANIEKTLATGVYCIDEIREKLGESELNTEFSKTHFITKNYAEIDEYIEDSMKGGE